MEEILLLLILLQIKHWYIDFVNQTDDEVKYKGVYGHKIGIMHSLKHGIGTVICLLIVTGYPYLVYAAILGIIDFAFHYHIDYAKMRWGEQNVKDKKFLHHFGLEQMMHQLTYILIAFLMT